MDNIKQEIELAQSTEALFSGIDAADAAVQANQERTHDRFMRRVVLPLVLLIVGAILGAVGAHAIMAQSAADLAAQADWTVPPCSAYAFTSHPDLPPYTLTDVCYTENADGGYTLSTGDHQWTAAY